MYRSRVVGEEEQDSRYRYTGAKEPGISCIEAEEQDFRYTGAKKPNIKRSKYIVGEEN